jgi:hypothetical protein
MDWLVLGVLVAIFVVLFIVYLWYDKKTTARQRAHFQESREKASKRMKELEEEILGREEGFDETPFNYEKRPRKPGL